jgi:hypothetical protein
MPQQGVDDVALDSVAWLEGHVVGPSRRRRCDIISLVRAPAPLAFAALVAEDEIVLTPEVFVPFEFPGQARPATHVRSTLIVSSMQTLRKYGHYDAYVKRLDPAYHDDLVSLIAGTWIPVEIGLAHYLAADALELDVRTIDSFGAEVSDRVNRSALALVLKISRQGGVTPWTAFARVHRLREETFDGTDISVTKLGPKDARFDWVGIPYAAVPYYRASFGGFLRALVQLFSATAYTRFLTAHSTPTSMSYRISWA